MWENFINSEMTFWLLGIADIVMILVMIYGAILWIKEEKRIKAIMDERFEKLEKLKPSKERNHD